MIVDIFVVYEPVLKIIFDFHNFFFVITNVETSHQMVVLITADRQMIRKIQNCFQLFISFYPRFNTGVC